MTGLERKAFDRLPDETWFYPGHGDETETGQQLSPGTWCTRALGLASIHRPAAGTGPGWLRLSLAA
jgi:glyoxylase-like metal-dependent hydrolase (beta-lactamase superfamily II)